MSGGLDILIVGIAGEDLDRVAPEETLRALFDDWSDAKDYHTAFYALVNNPVHQNPEIFYLKGEHMIGSQLGAGLGYVIFGGNLNDYPARVDEAIFRRIDELKEMFIRETVAKGLAIPKEQVGVYALNVCDT